MKIPWTNTFPPSPTIHTLRIPVLCWNVFSIQDYAGCIRLWCRGKGIKLFANLKWIENFSMWSMNVIHKRWIFPIIFYIFTLVFPTSTPFPVNSFSSEIVHYVLIILAQAEHFYLLRIMKWEISKLSSTEIKVVIFEFL